MKVLQSLSEIVALMLTLETVKYCWFNVPS